MTAYSHGDSWQLSHVPAEARAYQGESAGIVSRTAAGMIDVAVVAAALGGGYLCVAAVMFLWRPRGFSFPAPGFGVALAIAAVVLTIYFAWMWSTTGRTYGDQILGLRVVTARGTSVSGGRALIRAVACIAVPLGVFWAAIDRRNRSLQDLLTATRAIYDWEFHVPDLPNPDRAGAVTVIDGGESPAPPADRRA